MRQHGWETRSTWSWGRAATLAICGLVSMVACQATEEIPAHDVVTPADAVRQPQTSTAIAIAKGPHGVIRLRYDPLRTTLQIGPTLFQNIELDSASPNDANAREDVQHHKSGRIRQQWRVSHRPETPEFRVLVPVDAAYLGPRGNGHGFRSDGAEWRYGAATWISATGKRSPVASSWDGKSVVMHLGKELLDHTTYPAVLDPDIGPVTPLSEDINELAAGNQTGPVTVILPSGQILVIWNAENRGAVSKLLNPDGTTARPTELLGNGAFVPTGAACLATSCMVVGRRVSSAVGVLLGANGRSLGLPTVAIFDRPDPVPARPFVQVAADVGTYHVVSSDGQFNATPAYRSYDANGQLIASAPYLLDDSATLVVLQGQPLAIANEQLTASGYQNISIKDATNGTSLVDLPWSHRASTAAVFGDKLFVAWIDEQEVTRGRYFGAGLAPEGPEAVLGTASAPAPGGGRIVSAATENGVAVQWSGPTGALARVVPFGSATLEPQYFFGPASTVGRQTERHASHLFPDLGVETKIALQTLAINGVVDPTWVSTIKRFHTQVQLASNDGRFLAAITENTEYDAPSNPQQPSTTARTRVQWITAGQATLPTADLAWIPDAIVAHELGWMAVRIPFGPSGLIQRQLIPPTPAAIQTLTPTYAGSQGVTLEALWTHVDGDALMIVRGTIGGFVGYRLIHNEDKYPLVDYAPGEVVATAVAGSGSLVLSTTVDSLSDDRNIVGWWLDALPPPTPNTFPVVSYASDKRQPAVAWSGDRGLLVWADDRLGGASVFGARLVADGTTLDPEGFLIAATSKASDLNVVRNEHGQYVVGWIDESDDDTGIPTAAIVTADGAVLDVPGFALSDLTGDDLTLAATADGEPIAAFLEKSVIGVPSRAVMRPLASGSPLGAVCGQADDCASRSCEDEVCCAEPCGECARCDDGGECVPVVNASDDSCFGDRACDSAGVCLASNSELCTDAAQCASGHCVDGLCCNTACDDGCTRCDTVRGVCVPLDCGAFSCSQDRICIRQCNDSSECAPGHECVAGGDCVPNSTPEEPVDEGCGCRLVGNSPARGGWFVFALLASGALVRRSRFLS